MKKRKEDKNTKTWNGEPYPNVQNDREDDSGKLSRMNKPPPPRIEEQGIS